MTRRPGPVDPIVAAGVTDKDIAAAPRELRPAMRRARKVILEMCEAPLNFRPVLEAKARGDIDGAIEQAVRYGFELGRRTHDAIQGREFLGRMAGARAVGRRNAEERHADWQERRDSIMRDNPNLKHPEDVAEEIHKELQHEHRETGEPEKVPAVRTILNNIRKRR